MSSGTEQRFTAESLRSQTAAILEAWGMPQEQARTTARLMVETDLLDVESHGVSMLPQYEAMHTSSRLRLAADRTGSTATGYCRTRGHARYSHYDRKGNGSKKLATALQGCRSLEVLEGVCIPSQYGHRNPGLAGRGRLPPP